MTRLELLQGIIDSYDKKTYLEIGVSNGATFFRIKCKKKIAVDPKFAFNTLKKIAWNFINFSNLNNSYYQLDSNSFFKKNKETLISKGGVDLIFVDGMHTFRQSLEDILNSLDVLNSDGVIVVHDCYPPNEHAASPRKEYPTKAIKLKEGWKGAWCGDVWKSIHYLTKTLDEKLNISVLESDYGLGIITLKGSLNSSPKIDEALFNEILKLDYNYLMDNPEKLINLIDSKTLSQDNFNIKF